MSGTGGQRTYTPSNLRSVRGGSYRLILSKQLGGAALVCAALVQATVPWKICPAIWPPRQAASPRPCSGPSHVERDRQSFARSERTCAVPHCRGEQHQPPRLGFHRPNRRQADAKVADLSESKPAGLAIASLLLRRNGDVQRRTEPTGCMDMIKVAAAARQSHGP
jgi:hypothetical protein